MSMQDDELDVSRLYTQGGVPKNSRFKEKVVLKVIKFTRATPRDNIKGKEHG